MHPLSLYLFFILAGGGSGGPGASKPAPTAQLTVVAELVGRPNTVPHCGGVEFVEVMEYRIITIEEGAVETNDILVAHGCPELTRAQYDGGGALTRFDVGARHRLVLRRAAYHPAATERIVVRPRALEVHGPIDKPLYWSTRADPAESSE